jgi:hypothetical protein
MALFGGLFDDLFGGGQTPPPMMSSQPAPQMSAPAPAMQQPTAAPPDAMAQLAQAQAQNDPNQNKWLRALSMLGATLKDTGAGLDGRQSNNVQDLMQSFRQANLAPYTRAAQSQALDGLGSGSTLPADLPLKLAKMKMMGLDTTPLETYLGARSSMMPTYSKDDDGNVWQQTPGQPPQLLSKGPGKPTTVGPGQSIAAINPYDAAPAGAPAGSPTTPTAPPVSLTPTATGPALEQYIAQAFPGARVTSGQRTAAQNTAVNGVANSAHLTDNARDFVPPQGVSLEDAAAHFNSLGIPGLKAIAEGPGAKNSTGPHVHVQYMPPGGAAPAAPATAPAATAAAPPQGGRVLFQGMPEFRDLTPEEAKKYPGAIGMTIDGPKYPPQGAMPSQLSPEAIKQGAASFVQNGGKYPIGMRDKTSVAAIQNFVAGLKPQGMADSDWARVIQNNGLSLKARGTAAGKAGGMQVATAINEGTVNNSINILKGLIPLAASTGPITDMNNFTQAVSRHANNADAINFKNAIDSISAEYARVMTGSTTGAPSSDSARKEAGERILTGYNAGVLPKVLGQMQAEMRGRSQSYSDALGQITGGGYNGVDVPFSQPAAAPQPKAQGNVMRVKSISDWQKLPVGAQYYDPNGTLRTRGAKP